VTRKYNNDNVNNNLAKQFLDELAQNVKNSFAKYLGVKKFDIFHIWAEKTRATNYFKHSIF